MRVARLVLALAGAAIPLSLSAQADIAAPIPARLSLIDAIRLGRSRGVSETLARLNVRVVNARIGQRRADLLPTLSGSANITRRTINLEEFGFPGITGVSFTAYGEPCLRGNSLSTKSRFSASLSASSTRAATST